MSDGKFTIGNLKCTGNNRTVSVKCRNCNRIFTTTIEQINSIPTERRPTLSCRDFSNDGTFIRKGEVLTQEDSESRCLYLKRNNIPLQHVFEDIPSHVDQDEVTTAKRYIAKDGVVTWIPYRSPWVRFVEKNTSIEHRNPWYNLRTGLPKNPTMDDMIAMVVKEIQYNTEEIARDITNDWALMEAEVIHKYYPQLTVEVIQDIRMSREVSPRLLSHRHGIPVHEVAVLKAYVVVNEDDGFVLKLPKR